MKFNIFTILLTLLFCTSSYAERVIYRGPSNSNNGPFYLTTTTNASTGLTNSTSDKSKKNKKEVQLKRFVAENYYKISANIAKGSGEYIEAIAEILNVSEEDKRVFYKNLKKNFDDIFPTFEMNLNHVNDKIVYLSKI